MTVWNTSLNGCTKKAEKEMKNNPVHLITEEDLKQASVLESSISKKDKKDD